MKNAIDHLKTSESVDIAIATINADNDVLFATPRFNSLYILSSDNKLSGETNLSQGIRTMYEVNVDQKNLILEETFPGGFYKQFLLYAYAANSAYHIILCDYSEIVEYLVSNMRNEHLSIIGEMAAGTANSILNPLAIVNGSLQLIERSNSFKHLTDTFGHNQLEKHITMVKQQIQIIDQHIRRLLLVGKPFEVESENISTIDLLKNFIPKAQESAMKHKIVFVCEYPHIDSQLLLSQIHLVEVFNELLANAFEATKEQLIKILH
jgi:signal transduction histidine kinase